MTIGATVAGKQLAAGVELRGPGLFSSLPEIIYVGPGSLASWALVEGCCICRIGPADIMDQSDHTRNRPDSPRMPARNTRVRGVNTVEHLFAAMAGLGITDASLLCGAPFGMVVMPEDAYPEFKDRRTPYEVPILDGSAKPFVDAFLDVGFESADPVEPIVPPTRIEVISEDGASSVVIEPADTPSYRYELDYGPSAPIAPAAAEWDGDPASFIREVAPARTFCLAHEAEAMRAMGLFSAFTPRDMLVIRDDGQPIDNKLRFPDEPARHKLLDLIGDLAIIGGGRPLQASVTARRSGHRLHHLAARAVLASLT